MAENEGNTPADGEEDEPQDQSSGQMSEKTRAFSDKWKRAKASGERAVLQQLAEKTGISDLDTLADIVKTHNEKIESEGKALEEYKTRLQKLEQEKENTLAQLAQQKVEASVIGSLSALKPKKASVAQREFLSEFDIKFEDGSELVYQKGSNIPEGKDGQPATVAEVLQNWAGKKENTWLFSQPSGGHIDTSTGLSKRDRDASILKNTAYVEALKATGEFDNFMHNKPVDWKRVDAIVAGRSN